MENRFVYASNPDQGSVWKFIPDTPVERKKAIAEGCTAFSVYSYSGKVPEKGEKCEEPMRYGDLWLDIDDKENPHRAIDFAKELINKFIYHENFDPHMLKIFLSGSKGCHLCIPARTFGGEIGHTHLPIIHKLMLKLLLIHIHQKPLSIKDLDKSIIDTNMYKMGKGQLLREANIQRPDGRYKVQVSLKNFLELTSYELLSLCSEPNEVPIQIMEPEMTGLEKFFQKALLLFELLHSSKAGVRNLINCNFVLYCLSNSYELSRDNWFKMLGILKGAGAELELAQKFSEDYPKYTPKETSETYEDVSKYPWPTCASIRKIFTCPQNCKCQPITERLKSSKVQEQKREFQLRPDGTYMIKTINGESREVKIGSYVKVLGKIKSPDTYGWGILVEIMDACGCKKKLIIPTTDLVGKGDAVLGKLCDWGFMPEERNRYSKDILDYLFCQISPEIYIRVDKIGWYDKSLYILPDKVWGEDESLRIFYDAPENLFTTSGTLEDWQREVGVYCNGNTYAMLVSAYALTGVLLEPCNIEGGGLHLFGPSSSGKSTLALLAGSVCGGHPQRGFIRQWNTTANSLEKIAAMHNHSLLVLDELGQASSDAVATISYMLTNAQGKMRMRQDTSLRTTSTWLLVYLSTGELTFSNKIEQSGKNRSMAGQEVRVMNLPIGGKEGQNIFSELHGFQTPQELSHHIQKTVKRYWGTPLRAFLDKLFGKNSEELSNNLQYIHTEISRFVSENVPPDSNGQIIRVANKFGLIAAAGKFACEKSIFTWNPKEAWEVTREGFKIWLDERGGLESLEVTKAIDKLDAYIELYHFTRFIPISSKEDIKRIQNFTGYRSDNEKIIYIHSAILKNLIGMAYYEEVLNVLNSQNRLELDSKGSWILFRKIYCYETETVKSRRFIGIKVKTPPVKDDEEQNADFHQVEDTSPDTIRDAVF